MAGGGGWSASRYFCTASRGLEPLLREEVNLKLSATQ
ncbi:hypothetical protein chiPu_0024189, partial [Chiloscyllium punctatum]|nr:hypothetical protein [Chiloscyllium punctatum]